MDNNCQIVVFSDKAYNAIIRETFEWEPVETGGILLGHVLDNGCWIVMEVLPPGYGEGREGDNVFHEYGYFEYNRTFVNYLAKSVAEQYETPLELLGLWHRHPGSMDYFSGTDDGTNSTFAAQNPKGVISALVNVDPQFRMTMYYLSHSNARNVGRPNYQVVDVEVGSDLIPEEYFKLKYYRGEERDLHPYAPQRQTQSNSPRVEKPFSHVNSVGSTENQVGHSDVTDDKTGSSSSSRVDVSYSETDGDQRKDEHISDLENFKNQVKKYRFTIVLMLALVAFTISIFSIKDDFTQNFLEIKNNTSKNANSEDSISKTDTGNVLNEDVNSNEKAVPVDSEENTSKQQSDSVEPTTTESETSKEKE